MSDLPSLRTMAGDTGWEEDRRPILPNLVSDLLIAISGMCVRFAFDEFLKVKTIAPAPF